MSYQENKTDTTINICRSITSRNVIHSVKDLEGFIKLIKSSKRPEYKFIEKLRNLDRKSPEFDKIKKTKIPCAVLHFNYSQGIIRSTNTQHSTGYLYFDIDNVSESLKQELDCNEYVAAYWKSVSDTGFGLAVRVLGITLDNYLNVCKYIRGILKLPIDTNAHSIDRLTVISYDPDAVYKPESTIIDVSTINLSNTMIPSMHSKTLTESFFRNTINNRDYFSLGIHCDGKITLRYNNLDEVTENLNFQYDSNGVHDCGKDKINYHGTFLNKGIKNGNREKVLGLHAKSIMHLNPSLSKLLLHQYISRINILKLKEPLDYKEVDSIVNKAYHNQENFTPHYNKSKRFFFKDITLTPVEKSKKCLEVLNEERRQKTQEKKNMISKIFCNWDCHKDGEITPKKVIELGNGILKKTLVYNYFKDNKEDVPNCQ
ncbi:BT4734/BF3469 family protein [Chryseobacterium aureum]|uniref:BT4734/BF3469 family protein n=1 Tax=Chryseobacterium aureum TaxID=2497456 RepID=UPI000F893921|nr:BT4734/BF3469 family protein [Chryseobacterium aureum]